MRVFISWAADLERFESMAVWADDPEQLRRKAQALDRGLRIWQSWVQANDGSLVSHAGASGRAEISAEHLDDLPRILDQYQECIDLDVAVGIGSKPSEAEIALEVAQHRQPGTVLLYTPDVAQELEQIQNPEPDAIDELLDKNETYGPEIVGMAKGDLAAYASTRGGGLQGPSRPLGAAAPTKPVPEGSEHTQGEAVRGMIEDADVAPIERTHSARDAADIAKFFHQAARAQHQKDQEDEVQKRQLANQDALKQQVSQVLEQVKQLAPQMEQLSQAAPEIYQAVVAAMQAMITMAKGLMGAEESVHGPDEEGGEIAKSEKHWNTDSFRRWFGNSHVKTEEGKPLVVYHGSRNAGFRSFDPDRAGENTGRKFQGIYFTDSNYNATTYSNSREEADLSEDEDGYSESRPGNYPVYLSMQNPYILDYEGNSFEGTENLYGDFDEDADWIPHMDEAVQMALDAGHDGLIARNVNDEGRYGHGHGHGHTYVVFNPGQIKHASLNSGEYSEDDDSILKDEENPTAKSEGQSDEPPFTITTGQDGDFHIHSIGKKAGLPAEGPSATTYAVKANPKVLDPRFLRYVFEHAHSSGRFAPHVRGSVIQRITTKDAQKAMIEHFADLYGTKKSEDLSKASTPPVFPKLGLGDNRRETPVANTDLEFRNKSMLMSNVITRVSGIPSDPERNKRYADSHSRSGGFRGGVISPTPITSALGVVRGPDTFENLQDKPSDNEVRGTKQHEDFHQMLNRIEAKYGRSSRDNLARNLVMSLPKDLQDSIRHLHKILTGGSDYAFEEHIARTLNHVNSQGSRLDYHTRAKNYGVEASVDAKIKQAYRFLMAAAEEADESWLESGKFAKSEGDWESEWCEGDSHELAKDDEGEFCGKCGWDKESIDKNCGSPVLDKNAEHPSRYTQMKYPVGSVTQDASGRRRRKVKIRHGTPKDRDRIVEGDAEQTIMDQVGIDQFTGNTGWVQVEAGAIRSSDSTGHPISSRNPKGR